MNPLRHILILSLALPAGTARADLPVAAFFQPVRNLDALKAMGINTVAGPEVENSGSMTPAQLAAARDAWLKATAERGLKCVLKNPPPALPWNCVGILLSVDEPNGKSVKPAAMKAESDGYRAKYPGVPIFLSLAGDKVTSANFNRPDEAQLYKDYAALADVLTVDAYSMNRNATRYPVTWTGEAVKKLALVTNKPVWAWLETNDQQLSPPPAGQGINRAPMPDEIKATWEYAVKCGAKGIGGFFTCDSGKYGWPASYLPAVDRNGQSVQPQYDMFRTLALAANPPPPNDLQVQLDKARADLTAAQVELAAVRGDLDQARADAATAKADAAGARSKVNAAAAQAQTLVDTLKAAQPPPTTKPTTYIIPPEPGDPAKPYNYGHPSLWRPWTAVADTTQAQVQAFAVACRDGDPTFVAKTANGQPGTPATFVAKGAPCCLDYEDVFRPGTTPEKIALVHKHLDWFYAAYPGADLALAGVPQWANDDVTTAALAGLHNRCRSIITGIYEYRAADFARQEGEVRKTDAGARGHYPGKPVQCWVMPVLMDTDAAGKNLPMPPDLGARVWALAVELSKPGDSIVVFGGTWAEKVAAYGDQLK